MFRVNLVFYLSIIWITAHAQIPKKALKAYEKAKAELASNNVNKAIENFNKAISIYPAYKSSYLELYTIYLDKNDGVMALANLESGLKYADKDPKYAGHKPNILFQVAKLSLEIGNYQKSLLYANEYLSLNTKDENTRELAGLIKLKSEYSLKNISSKHKYNPVLLSNLINTPSPEYLPSLDATQENLVFTRRIKGNEDLYIARKKYTDSSWQSVVNWPLNTAQNEGAHTISADGKTLVFTRCNMPDGLGNCDLYISELKASIWTKPKNMGSSVNSTSWESQPSLSANGRTIYFASSRPGGKGGSDLWKSEKTNNVWRSPVNLGDGINTKWDEASPFIHADGVHLYFRSNGLPGYGAYDIYRSNLESDSWKTPMNLGYPINDHRDQGSIVIGLDGSTAYYTDQNISLRNELLESNIASYNLGFDNAALPCIFLKGKTMDATSKSTLANAILTFISNSSVSKKDSIVSDTTGEFLLILPSNVTFQVYASAEGFDFFTDRINTVGMAASNFQYNIELSKVNRQDSLVTEKSIVLKNVLFKTGSAILENESSIELDRVLDYLQKHTNLSAEFIGHTDNIGNSINNKTLSFNRAKTVYEYLTNNGIEKNRLSFAGSGDSMPIADNTHEAGRSLNRRVEIRLIKK